MDNISRLPTAKGRPRKPVKLLRDRLTDWEYDIGDERLMDGVLLVEIADCVKAGEKALIDVFTLAGWVVRCDPDTLLPLWYPRTWTPTGDGWGTGVSYQKWVAMNRQVDALIEQTSPDDPFFGELFTTLGQYHSKNKAALHSPAERYGQDVADAVYERHRVV